MAAGASGLRSVQMTERLSVDDVPKEFLPILLPSMSTVSKPRLSVCEG